MQDYWHSRGPSLRLAVHLGIEVAITDVEDRDEIFMFRMMRYHVVHSSSTTVSPFERIGSSWL